MIHACFDVALVLMRLACITKVGARVSVRMLLEHAPYWLLQIPQLAGLGHLQKCCVPDAGYYLSPSTAYRYCLLPCLATGDWFNSMDWTGNTHKLGIGLPVSVLACSQLTLSQPVF